MAVFWFLGPALLFSVAADVLTTDSYDVSLLASDVCDKQFKPDANSIFMKGCGSQLDSKLKDRIYKDCKHFISAGDSGRFDKFLRNINMVCNQKGFPVCRDIVFMAATSNTMISTDFDVIKNFIRKITSELLHLSDSVVSNFVGMIKFDNTVAVTTVPGLTSSRTEVSEAICNILYTGGTTHINLAIDNMKILMDQYHRSRFRCQKVGVLLTPAKSVNSLAFYKSLASYTIEHKDTIMIAIPIAMADEGFRTQMMAFANGIQMNNVLPINHVSELGNKFSAVADMLSKPRPKLADKCRAYYTDPPTGQEYYSVYEQIDDKGCELGAITFPIFYEINIVKRPSTSKYAMVATTVNALAVWAIRKPMLTPICSNTNIAAVNIPPFTPTLFNVQMATQANVRFYMRGCLSYQK